MITAVFVFSIMRVYLYPSKFDIGCGVHLTDSRLVVFGGFTTSIGSGDHEYILIIRSIIKSKIEESTKVDLAIFRCEESVSFSQAYYLVWHVSIGTGVNKKHL